MSIWLCGCTQPTIDDFDLSESGTTTSTGSSDRWLDIATWNIETFPKNNLTSATVAELILRLDVDVIALQEITDDVAFQQMVDEIPGWEVYFDSQWYAGLAYLYNTDTIDVADNYEIYTTEPYWSAFPRSPQVMEFGFFGVDFIIVNNHLKCCGDGALDADDSDDEEARRLEATTLLKAHIDTHWQGKRVVVVGDLNDSLIDAPVNNVFLPFLDDAENYLFADMDIAEGDAADWSYPSYPSHLDHIVITGALFADFARDNSYAKTILVDESFENGWPGYERDVSDHRPVVLRIALPEVLPAP
ncbi:MAG: hypothetical protein GWP91_14275 [Rhodobacterales bacterium]|nr:hypothetical protein [Rhodobacterales bacterium]